jgi:Pirin C-terminal cupin domain
MLLGGEPVGPRHIWWNFVSSSHERLERAKADWKAGRFALPQGDDKDFIPLPEDPPPPPEPM